MSKDAESPQTTDAGFLGLAKLGPITNLSAVVVVLWMFWQQHSTFLDQARTDRQMFQAELKEMRSASDKQWDAVRDLQRTVLEQTAAVKALADEIKRSKDKPE